MSARPPAPPRRIATRACALALGLALALIAAEFALRWSGSLETYSERGGGRWADVWGRAQPTWIHAYQPGERVRYAKAEFTFEHVANREGVIDRERELEAPPGRRRVLVLGDSFAEGVGAADGESWPAVLDAELRAAGLEVEVLGAGMSGSDPCFEYQLLRHRFLRYRPDVVLVALNETDLADLTWWGGMARFQADGTARGRPAPRGFALYRHSHLARALFHGVLGLDRATLSFGSSGQLTWEAQLAAVEACAAIDGLRSEADFALLVLVHPIPALLPMQTERFLPAFHERLRERDIASWDLSTELARELAGLEPDQYAWPIDGHFNARGYAAFGRVVARRLLADAELRARLR